MALEPGRKFSYEAGALPRFPEVPAMPTVACEYRGEAKRIAIERAVAFVAELSASRGMGRRPPAFAPPIGEVRLSQALARPVGPREIEDLRPAGWYNQTLLPAGPER